MKQAILFCLLLLTGQRLLAQLPGNPGLAALLSGGPELVSRQFRFTEGPAVDRKGNIYFTDQPQDNIWKYDRRGRLSLFMSGTQRANGLYVDRQGNILACADEDNKLIRISPQKKQSTILSGYSGSRFNGPNDLWIAPDGVIFFTDPYYKRDYWPADRKRPSITQNVYALLPGDTEPVVLDSQLTRPNGIVGTPDGKTLYVADIGAGKTYRYAIGANGRLSGKQLFATQGSDGMTLDDRGNLYLTGEGVTVYAPDGQKIGNIPIPEKWSANVCFGGKKKRTLFVTASEALYKVRMKVSGVE
jgi:gluconolactonase